MKCLSLAYLLKLIEFPLWKGCLAISVILSRCNAYSVPGLLIFFAIATQVLWKDEIIFPTYPIFKICTVAEHGD